MSEGAGTKTRVLNEIYLHTMQKEKNKKKCSFWDGWMDG